MKKISLSIISFLFSTLLNAQSIDLSLGQENLTLDIPSTFSINLEITPDNFSHQLFFTVGYSNLPESVDLSFSESSLTSPYEGGQLNINVLGGAQEGDYEIHIKAYNGPVWDVDTCFITISKSLCDWKTYPQPKVNFASNIFFDMAVDEQNNFWITSVNYLMKFNKNTGYSLISTNDLGVSNINKIAVDKMGNKWIYLLNQGILKYDGSLSEIYTTTNSPLPSKIVNDLKVDSKGILWIATDKGLCNFDGNFWGLYTSSNSNLSGDTIRSITEDSNGKIWAVCDLKNDEVFRLEDNQWIKNNSFINCSFNLSIDQIVVDSLNNVWLAASNGIYKVDDNQIEYWEKNLNNYGRHIVYQLNTCETITSVTDSPLKYLDLTGIAEAENSEIWVTGTGDRYNTGLVLKFDGSWQSFDNTNSNLPQYSFIDVATDKNGKPWIMADHYSLTETYYYYYGNMINFDCEEDVITGNSDLVGTKNLMLYPNPARIEINFDPSLVKNISRVYISDVMGRKIEVTDDLDQNNSGLNIETLTPGIYILTIESEGNSVSSRFCKR